VVKVRKILTRKKTLKTLRFSLFPLAVLCLLFSGIYVSAGECVLRWRYQLWLGTAGQERFWCHLTPLWGNHTSVTYVPGTWDMFLIKEGIMYREWYRHVRHLLHQGWPTLAWTLICPSLITMWLTGHNLTTPLSSSGTSWQAIWLMLLADTSLTLGAMLSLSVQLHSEGSGAVLTSKSLYLGRWQSLVSSTQNRTSMKTSHSCLRVLWKSKVGMIVFHGFNT
jgi:hypothetical protein